MNPVEFVTMVLKEAETIIHEEILAALTRLGEECVARIRTRSNHESWIDRTGNLRSSIGYAIFDYGQEVISSAFDAVAAPEGDGRSGSARGQEYIRELANRYSDTYALVVVAGMDYAEYVEAIESKDVLASTEVWAKQKVDSYLEDAKDRAAQRINDYMQTI